MSFGGDKSGSHHGVSSSAHIFSFLWVKFFYTALTFQGMVLVPSPDLISTSQNAPGRLEEELVSLSPTIPLKGTSKHHNSS
jgi:hypothetical protein